MLVSRSLSAMTELMVSFGMAANASFTGANTVKGPPVFNVSTSPASLTALTSVDSAGLFDAAVATGSLAMPSRLPSPSAGSDEQAGPSGAAAIASAVVDVS